MSEDDRTMIQGPGGQPPGGNNGGGESTVIRPVPGGRPIPGGGGGGAIPPSGGSPYGTPPQQPRAMAPDPYLNRPAEKILIKSGENFIVNAASTLLAVLVKLRNTVSHENVSALYSQLSQEIKQFEHRIKQEGARAEIALAARYCICSALDEAVLNTPWGAHSHWGQKTLLSAFHNETSGGEKFFLILDRMLQEPGQNVDMIELLYLLLSFGFEGKYRVVSNGKEQVDQLKDNLFRTVRSYRGDFEKELSPHWQGTGGKNSSLINYIPLWVIAACIGAVMLLTFSGFKVWLYKTATPVYESLEQIEAKDNLNQ